MKETLSQFETQFVNFKSETVDKFKATVNSTIFEDKINSISQSQKFEIKNLKSNINDLELSNEILKKEGKTLVRQDNWKIRRTNSNTYQISERYI